MRHRKGFNHLGRTSSHRKAMLANMATSLILHKRITTTTAKAKALRSYVEPLITKSKDDTTHSRRVVFSYLKNKYAVSELFREVSPKIVDRPGGYTRILKLGNRLGDNADICIIELVDYNENLLEAADKKPKSTRRRRSSGKKKEAEEASSSASGEATADKVEAEEAVKAVEAEEASTSASGEATADKVEAVEAVKAEEAEEKVEEEAPIAAKAPEDKKAEEAAPDKKAEADSSEDEEKKDA